MKVFITGGTGFVGTTLSRKLAQEGHKVTVLTRSLKGHSAALEEFPLLKGIPLRKAPGKKRSLTRMWWSILQEPRFSCGGVMQPRSSFGRAGLRQ